jgi:hypothetical protein
VAVALFVAVGVFGISGTVAVAAGAGVGLAASGVVVIAGIARGGGIKLSLTPSAQRTTAGSVADAKE